MTDAVMTTIAATITVGPQDNGARMSLEQFESAAGLESERHPDLAIYKTARPDQDIWSTWIPEIVVEVVSRSSIRRDYEEKPPEYLAFGVQEHWIVDPFEKKLMLLLRSRGNWRSTILTAGDVHCSQLVPGFELNVSAILTPE